MPEILQSEDEIAVLAPGSVVADRYTIIEAVGHGGMGVVYKARQMHIDRTVALKMLLNDSGSVGFKRFKQEAQAASMLNHPHIVAIHDFGLLSENQAYLTMDFLDGKSVSDVFEETGVVSLERFKHIFLQACDALEHAHSKGVVHRDIKPSNLVLVDRPGDKDFLVVVDFGLVKLMENSGQQKLTVTNAVVGSPLYMSPEQCRAIEVDHRTDIYSLGCVMYQALTNSYTLIGETVMDTMIKHISENPIPLREARPDLYIPPALERLVLQTLAKEPADRPQSMQELGERLKAALSGAPDGIPVVSILNQPAADGAGSPGAKPSAQSNSAEKRGKNSDAPNVGTGSSSSPRRTRQGKSSQERIGSEKKAAKTFGVILPVVAIVALVSIGVLIGEMIKSPAFNPQDRASSLLTNPSPAASSAVSDNVPHGVSPAGVGSKSLSSSRSPGELVESASSGFKGAANPTVSRPAAVPQNPIAAGTLAATAASVAPAPSGLDKTSTESQITSSPLLPSSSSTANLDSGSSGSADQLLQDGLKSFALHDWSGVNSSLSKWLALQRTQVGFGSPTSVRVLAMLAVASYQMNDQAATSSFLSQFTDRRSQFPDALADDPELVIQVALLMRATDSSDLSAPEKLLRDGIESYSQKHSSPDKQMLRMQMELSRIYADSGRPEDCLRVLRQSMDQSKPFPDMDATIRSKISEMSGRRPPALPGLPRFGQAPGSGVWPGPTPPLAPGDRDDASGTN